jgi:hypothetical protein
MGWVGHEMDKRKLRNAYRTLNGKPIRKISLRRYRSNLEENNKMYLM